MQRCFSDSSAHGNGAVTSVAPSLSFAGAPEGGSQVATVNASTSLRTKKRGKVPPRFETLQLTIRYGNEAKSFALTYVARSVIYVPPMTGSAIFAWKAEIATNIIVLVKVVKTCAKMTVRRYHFVVPPAGKMETVN